MERGREDRQRRQRAFAIMLLEVKGLGTSLSIRFQEYVLREKFASSASNNYPVFILAI